MIKDATYSSAILLGFVAAALLTTLALFPYISTAGDSFSCWYPYIENWTHFGLAEALRRADSPGRYPGYALMIIIIQTLSHTSFLDALRISRIIGLVGGFLALWSLLRKAKFGLIRGWAFSVAVFCIPAVWTNIALNSQDTLKICFYLVATTLAVDLVAEFYKMSGLSRTVKYVLFCLSSIFLMALRGPEVFPLLGFILLYCGLNFRSKKQSTVAAAALVFPSLISLTAIHLYGLSIVHHWSVSGVRGAKDFWPILMVDALHHSALGAFGMLAEWLRLGAVVFINKSSYLIEDFVFHATPMRILDFHFVSSLELVTTMRLFIFYPLAIATTAFFLWCLLKKSTEPLPRCLIFAASIASLYYFFILNHYEPRYWLIAVISLLTGLILMFGHSRIFFVGTLLVSAFVLIPCTYFEHQKDLRIDKDTQQLAQKWIRDVTVACNEGVEEIYIPANDFAFTSYRYFVAPICSFITIHSLAELTPGTKANHKIISFSETYFDDVHIVGLEKGKIDF